MITSNELINCPVGSVYFSQLNALRWKGKNSVDILRTLYNEILLYGLQASSVVVSDSHILTNAWLRDLILSEEDYGKGLRDMITEGVLLVAKRRDNNSGNQVPLTDTAAWQINRAPVNVDGNEVMMPPDFPRHAQLLERLTTKSLVATPVYDTKHLDLKKRMEQALSKPSVYIKYGITKKLANQLLGMFESNFLENGLFMAAKLHRLPDVDLRFKPYAESIKSLATSVHSCNFALSYHIPPSTSSIAIDHIGVMSLYEDYLPQLQGSTDEDFLAQGKKKNKKYSSPAVSLTSITPKILFRIRNSEIFRDYILKKELMLYAYKNYYDNPLLIREAVDEFAESTLKYVSYIFSLIDVSVHPSSEVYEHFTEIQKIANTEKKRSFWLWQSGVLGGFVTSVLIEKEAEQFLQKTKQTSEKLLYGTNRILNLV